MCHPIELPIGDFTLRVDAMISQSAGNGFIYIGLTDDVNDVPARYWEGLGLEIGHYEGFYADVKGRYDDGRVLISMSEGKLINIEVGKWYSYELSKQGSTWKLDVYDENGLVGSISGELTGSFSPFNYVLFGNGDTSQTETADGRIDNLELLNNIVYPNSVDITPLLSGVNTIHSYGIGGNYGVPGPLEALSSGPVTLPFISAEDNQPKSLAMATTYGSGRVVALGHDGFFINEGISDVDNRRFGENIVNWLNGPTNRRKVLVTTGHGEPLVGSGAYSSFYSGLSGYDVTIHPGPITSQALSDVSVLFISVAGTDFSSAEIDAIKSFVSNGGGLFIQGLGWAWVGYSGRSIDEYPMNKVAEPFGIRFLSGYLFHTFFVSQPTPTINVTKTANPASGMPGSLVNFTINVTNTGDCDLYQIEVTDTLPVGMSYLSAEPSPQTVLTWNYDHLAPGEQKQILIPARVDEDASGTLVNNVNVVGSSSSGCIAIDSDTCDYFVESRTSKNLIIAIFK